MASKSSKVSKMVKGITSRFLLNPFAIAETHLLVSRAKPSSTHCRNIMGTFLGPVLSVRVYSPTEGVIGVKIQHFKHIDPTPNFNLFPDAPPITAASLSRNDLFWTVATGGLTAEISENPYSITFKSPAQILTTAGYKFQAIYDVPYKWTLRSASNGSCLATDTSSNPHPQYPPETVRYVHSELNLSPGELIYGLGEQFGAFVKNGKYQTGSGIPRKLG